MKKTVLCLAVFVLLPTQAWASDIPLPETSTNEISAESSATVPVSTSDALVESALLPELRLGIPKSVRAWIRDASKSMGKAKTWQPPSEERPVLGEAVPAQRGVEAKKETSG